MRVVLVLFVAAILLSGCKREAQEAVAETKGAAAEAQKTAKDAAAQARAAADEAAAKTRAAADEAAAKAKAAAHEARGAAASANESAREGVNSAGQALRDLTAGDVVTGVLVGAGSTELSIRPAAGAPQTFHTDGQTRWVAKGPATDKGAFPTGSTVRVTYIVRNGQRLATQVEAVPR
jgi:hypothetical protein